LATEIDKLAEKCHIADIGEYARQLQDGLEHFDVEKIQKALDGYPEFLGRLKANRPTEEKP
jgi:hypothetical protein